MTVCVQFVRVLVFRCPPASKCEASVLFTLPCPPGPFGSVLLPLCCDRCLLTYCRVLLSLRTTSSDLSSAPFEVLEYVPMGGLTWGEERSWPQSNEFCPGGFLAMKETNQSINILNQTTLNFVNCFILFLRVHQTDHRPKVNELHILLE